MARKKIRKLARTALALAATTVAEVALQKIADNPKVQRKAKAAAGSASRSLKRTGKKLIRATKRRGKGTAAGKRRGRKKATRTTG
jgi:mevalonate pyrophosphate decarboxylase